MRKDGRSGVGRQRRAPSAANADRQCGPMFTAVALAGLLEASILLSYDASGEADAGRFLRKRPVERDGVALSKARVRNKKPSARK